MPRKRDIQMKFFVDEKEKRLIDERKDKLAVASLSSYLRQLAISGTIINVDTSSLKEMTQAINRIGVNVNQIAHRANETNSIYKADLDAVKECLEKVWQLQRSVLSQQR